MNFVFLQAKAMQDPEIQNILQDPVMRQVCFLFFLECWCVFRGWNKEMCLSELGCVLFMQVLVDFQENPKAAQEHTKNPMVMNKIQKLVSAGIVQMK